MSESEIEVRNNAVLAQLRSLGDDLDSPHEVDHFFYGSDEGLERIKSALLEFGMKCEASGDGRLHMTVRMPLSSDAIHTTTARLDDLARANGAEYDGWGTATVRRPPPPWVRLGRLLGGWLGLSRA